MRLLVIPIRVKPDLFSPLCLNDQWATEIANLIEAWCYE